MKTKIKQGDIVLIPFPYTNLQASKVRPVLVFSNHKLNKGGDFLGMAISTTNRKKLAPIKLSNIDMAQGKIIESSFLYPHKIYLLEQVMIRKVVAQGRPEIIKKAKQSLENYYA